METIKFVKGDATLPIGEGRKLIVHICNDVGGWGKGFVLALSNRWKTPELAYRDWYKTKDKFGLGEVQFIQVEKDLIVVNMIAQHKIKSRNNIKPIRYEALEKCLNKVAIYANENGGTVHMPRIGCGLAGGKWEEIEKIINKTLLRKDVSVTVYDFT